MHQPHRPIRATVELDDRGVNRVTLDVDDGTEPGAEYRWLQRLIPAVEVLDRRARSVEETARG